MGRKKTSAVAGKEALGPRSLARLLGLFDALARAPEGLTLAQLNALLESPKSSLLNLLRPLVAADYLSHNNGRYRLGTTLFRLAGKILSGWSFIRTLRPFLEELAARSHESVFLAVLDREMQLLTFVDALDSTNAVRYAVPVGSSRPLYCTAAGRVLLAFTDKDWTDRYLRTAKLVRRTPDTMVDRKALRRTLENIRETGISICIGELSPDAACVGAPVFGADGKLIAAISIGAPSARARANLAALIELLKEVALRASGGVVMPKHGGSSHHDRGAGVGKG